MKTKIQNFYKIIKGPLLIKLTFPFLFLLMAFKPMDANRLAKLPRIRKEFKIETAFNHIRIEGDISLVLTNDPAGTVIIEGNEKDIKKMSPSFENTILVIDASRKCLFAKLTIYLSAINMQAVQLNGDGNISSSGFIKSDCLQLSLNGNIKVKVKTMGQISFDTPDDVELVKPPVYVKKN